MKLVNATLFNNIVVDGYFPDMDLHVKNSEINTSEPAKFLKLIRIGWESINTVWEGADPQTPEEEIELAMKIITEGTAIN